jgi:hypothetical protein
MSLLADYSSAAMSIRLTIGSEAENNHSKDSLGATKRKHKVHHFEDKKLIELTKEFK